MRVLIFSSMDDGHARAVRDLLLADSHQVEFLRRSDVLTNSFRFALNNGISETRFFLDNKELALGDFDSIWYRRPGGLRAHNFVERWIGQMVESEASAALDGFFKATKTLWVNDPSHNLASTNKIWQLEIAREVGLPIPDTIVTNIRDEVLTFFERCDGEVIYKLMGETTNQHVPPDENPRGVSTQKLLKSDLPHLGQVTLAPHLFQKNIPKAYDVRVTIVGVELFATRIHSQVGKGKIDWRNDYSVPMDSFDLPEHVRRKCFQIMHRLKLNYGAIDFVQTPANDYVFLEINCGGQYMWVEEITKQKISLAMSRLLSRKLQPLVEA